jgi:hypothetical protein
LLGGDRSREGDGYGALLIGSAKEDGIESAT